jgi:hypothetical protein
MAEEEEWAKTQSKPLGMFDLANKWVEAIKVIGAGNAAGVVAAGAALTPFAKYPTTLILIKFGGLCFFTGVFLFACAFAAIHLSVFQYDEMLHAARRKDQAEADKASKITTSAMNAANRLAILSTLAFFLGLVVGVITFMSF